MAEAIATLEGARCLSLGTQSPVREIVSAALAHQVDVVAISVSASASFAEVRESLALLRGQLAPRVALWCGGAGAARLRRLGRGVQRLGSLEALATAIVDWRATPALEGRA